MTIKALNAFTFINKRPSVNNQHKNEQEQQLKNTISLIMRTIEARRQPIRKSQSDQIAVKKCLIELAKEMFESIEIGLILNLKDFLDNINR